VSDGRSDFLQPVVWDEANPPYPDQNEVYQTRDGRKARFLMELAKRPVPENQVDEHRRFLYAIETSPNSSCYFYHITHQDGTSYGVCQSGPLRLDILPFAAMRWGHHEWHGE
jgi:hypothetical protein